MDSSFLRSISLEMASRQEALSKTFHAKDELATSSLLQLSCLQDSSLFVARKRALILADLLLTPEGLVNQTEVERYHAWFSMGMTLFSVDREVRLEEHFLRILERLKESSFSTLLHKFSLPLVHRFGEDLVRYSLFCEEKEPLTDRMIRKSVLSSLLTPLRQNVGACFATAPAILIQQDEPDLLLQDLYDLLTTSKLTRTFGGISYSIPMSFSTGVSDLRRNVLGHPSFLSPSLLSVFSPFAPVQDSAAWLQTRIEQIGKGKKTLTVQELIEEVLLSHFSLTKETIEKKESLEKAQVEHFQRGLISFAPSHSKTVAQVDQFKKAYERCLESFKAFCDHPLLKVWEFTIASFSEVKMEFSKWNFAISLGFSHTEKGGIGSVIFHEIEERLKEINKQVAKYHEEYVVAFEQTRATDSLLRNAGSEQEGRRLLAEHRSRSYHMRMSLEMRDTWKEKGEQVSKLYPFLVGEYEKKFPEYFQELYDPNMQEIQEGMYEDSPAGFRLVYKHGRQDPHLWTLVYKEEQYLQFLTEFFNLTENEISSLCEWEGGKEAVRKITSKILLHLHEKEFLTSAIQRMKQAHGGSQKTPWSYISGGTMSTLVKTYYAREGELTCEEKRVENPIDLCVFILDALKNLPPRITDLYEQKKSTGMLMNSPSHAYLLLPEKSKLGWQGGEFAYTWVRDQLITPSVAFYQTMELSQEEQQFLYDKLVKIVPLPLFHFSGTVSPKEFRQILTKSLKKQQEIDQIDAFLFESLPVISQEMVPIRAARFLRDLDLSSLQLPKLGPFVTAREFHELVKGLYISLSKGLALSCDLHAKIASMAKKEGTAQPCPLIVADTNWPENYFAFVINPGTFAFEFWRVYGSCLRGSPMSQWKNWFSSQGNHKWTLYTHPEQYKKYP